MAFSIHFFILLSVITKNWSDGQSISQSNIELTITDGRIIGTKRQTEEENNTYYAFKGIPYAEPPVNELRFAPPVEKKPWDDVLNCTYDKSQCTQGSNPVAGSEDCLFINVYTRSPTGNSAVLVFIHGGAFVGGNSSETVQNPEFFLNEGLVFVQFNYRLGLFGFMSTEDSTCPGNWGLKDQVVALQWVQKNIALFGGDPKNVTIFGQSAGSVSVSLHMQSKLSKGLFKGAIMDSGTSLCLWSRSRNARSNAFSVGKEVGISTDSTSALLTKLKGIDYNTLQEAASKVFSQETLKNVLAGLAFAPVKEILHDGAFLSDNSEEMLQKGEYTKVPTLLGLNSNEAASANSVSGFLRLYLAKYDTSLTDLAPADLNDKSMFKLKAVGANTRIKCQYFKCGSLSLSSDDVISNFISDDQFNRPVRRAVIDQSQYSTTYFYVFSYTGRLGGSLNRTLKGVGHTEELPYLFKSNLKDISSNDHLTRRRMVRLWSNFAKFSNPTPTQDSLLQNVIWSATQSENVTYLSIDTALTQSFNPFDDRMKFYDALYTDLGTPPYDTY